MNACFFTGPIVTDIETRKVGGVTVANFRMAVRDRRNSDSPPTYVTMELWDSGAERLAAEFRKGDELSVECSLRSESRVDKEGVNRFRTYFRVSEFRGLTDIRGFRSQRPEEQEAAVARG